MTRPEDPPPQSGGGAGAAGGSGPPPYPIPLESASNLRDLGGYATAHGQTVRRHRLYRAPALANLTPSDHATIASLNLRTVIDLRGTSEARHTPIALPGATRIHLPIEPTVGAGLRDILRTGQLTHHTTAEDMRDLLAQAYRAYATQNLHIYQELFRLIAEAELPLLFHCSAGKDRTGFAAALLLRALEIPHAQIIADYLATNHLWRRENARHFDLPADVAEALLAAQAPLLEQALALAPPDAVASPGMAAALRARLLTAPRQDTR